MLSSAPGTCPLPFELAVPEIGLVTVQAGASWAIDPVPSVAAALQAIVGGGVSLTFG